MSPLVLPAGHCRENARRRGENYDIAGRQLFARAILKSGVGAAFG